MIQFILCLFAGLIFFPIIYLMMCETMKALPNPPRWPWFLVFGVIGGYTLALAFAPSFISLMIGSPVLLGGLLSLPFGLISFVRAKPRSRYHTVGAAVTTLLLMAIAGGLFFPSFTGLSHAGTWEDDAKNWSRAFGGQSCPTEVTVYHSHYSRSPHFTYEAEYFFEVKLPDAFLDEWIRGQSLVKAPPTADNTRSHGNPPWFRPKPLSAYDMWLPGDDSESNFRLFQDRETKIVHVTDAEGGL